MRLDLGPSAIDVFDRRERKLCQCPAREGCSANAAFLYWVFVLLWVTVVPPPGLIPDGMPSSASGAAYLLLEVVSGIVAYDALFFAVHWGLHAHDFGGCTTPT